VATSRRSNAWDKHQGTGNIISGDAPSLQATLTDVLSPGSSTDEFRAGSTSTTKKSASKNKGKKPVKLQKPVMMRAATTQTARHAVFYMSQTDPKLIQSRNLYAIDYLKDDEVTRDEFATVWNELEDDHRQVKSTHYQHVLHSHLLQIYIQRAAALKRQRKVAGFTSKRSGDHGIVYCVVSD
jgi:hypothetical protein